VPLLELARRSIESIIICSAVEKRSLKRPRERKFEFTSSMGGLDGLWVSYVYTHGDGACGCLVL
jgi:hypothetical protein